MTPDNLRATIAADVESAERDRLREALVQEFQQARGGFAQTEDDVAHADALLAGPVGDLLADLADHDAQVRADEREKIAAAIHEIPVCGDVISREYGLSVRNWAENIARSGGAS